MIGLANQNSHVFRDGYMHDPTSTESSEAQDFNSNCLERIVLLFDGLEVVRSLELVAVISP